MAKRVLEILFYLLYSLFYVGLFFHRQPSPGGGSFSWKYILALAGLFTIYFIPLGLRFFVKKLGTKHAIFASIPLLGLLVFGYLGSSVIYYHTRSHHFDPFLQMTPAQFRANGVSKSEGTYRILTLGGSTTQNLDLPAEHRYPRVLERLLQEEYPDVQVEVINAGTNWYTSKHSLINYSTHLRGMKPDLVIVMHAINDLYRSFSDSTFAVGDYNTLWSHYYGPAIHGAQPPTLEAYLFSGLAKRWFSDFRVKEQDFPLSRYVAMNEFETHLETLVEYIRADHIRTVLMTQPSIYKDEMTAKEKGLLIFGRNFCKDRKSYFEITYPSAVSLGRAMSACNDKTRDIASQQEVALVDLAENIPRDSQHFTDDVHYTIEGARRVASTLAQAIIEQEMIEP